jgi:hypothetical protein
MVEVASRSTINSIAIHGQGIFSAGRAAGRRGPRVSSRRTRASVPSTSANIHANWDCEKKEPPRQRLKWGHVRRKQERGAS